MVGQTVLYLHCTFNFKLPFHGICNNYLRAHIFHLHSALFKPKFLASVLLTIYNLSHSISSVTITINAEFKNSKSLKSWKIY